MQSVVDDDLDAAGPEVVYFVQHGGCAVAGDSAKCEADPHHTGMPSCLPKSVPVDPAGAAKPPP